MNSASGNKNVQVFTAKDLQGFELEVARYLAKIPISGYTLLGFKFFNQELFEISGLIVSDEGMVCCLEIKDNDGVWLGTTDGVWSTATGEIACSMANNPWKQVNYDVLYIKNLLWSKLNKATSVNGAIIVPNEAQIRIPNISVDVFNRNNPLTLCHLSKLDAVFSQMQSAFKLPYEQGRAANWIYALTGISEAALLENSVIIEPLIIKVRQDVQRAIAHNTDLTEQILGELINFNNNMQKVFTENTELINRFIAELANFKQEISSKNTDLSSQLLTEMEVFKQAIKEQNAYLIGRLFTEITEFQQEAQSQNSDLTREFFQEIGAFKREIQQYNHEFASQVANELQTSRRQVQQDLQRLVEQNSALINQIQNLEALVREPKGFQKLWSWFNPKKKKDKFRS